MSQCGVNNGEHTGVRENHELLKGELAVNIFENFLAKYPKPFALLMLVLGLTNAYLTYLHLSSPLRALFDGFFAVLGIVVFFLVVITSKRRKGGPPD